VVVFCLCSGAAGCASSRSWSRSAPAVSASGYGTSGASNGPQVGESQALRIWNKNVNSATLFPQKLKFSSSLCLADLNFVVVHLLKSIIAGKKKSRKKVVLAWDLILQWWYFGLVASEDLQEKCSQQEVRSTCIALILLVL